MGGDGTSYLSANPTVIRSAKAMLVSEGHLEASPEVGRAIQTIASVAFRLDWLRPSDEKGSFTAMVYAADGQLIDMAEAVNPEDALLAVADRLVPLPGRPQAW